MKKNFKIAYFSDTTPPHPNGVASHIEDATKELEKRGYEIGIFAPKIKGQKSTENVKYFTLPSLNLPRKIFNQEASLAIPIPFLIKNKLTEFSPNIIHIQTPYTAGWVGRKLAQRLNIPVVETFHGYIMDEGYLKVFSMNRAKSLTERLLWKTLVKQLNSVPFVISPSKKAKEDLITHGLKSKITVIPNGIKLKKTTTKLSKENNILYLGRLSWEKNLINLLTAFKKLLKNIPDAKLFLVGDGPARDYLERDVHNMALDTQIKFSGFLPREKILTEGFFRKFKVFATMSKSENNPISVIESMSYGLPVVAVHGRGMDELVRNVGFLCEPNDTTTFASNLIKVLNNNKLRQRMSSKSKLKAKKYNIKNCANKLLKTYKELDKIHQINFSSI